MNKKIELTYTDGSTKDIELDESILTLYMETSLRKEFKITKSSNVKDIKENSFIKELFHLTLSNEVDTITLLYNEESLLDFSKSKENTRIVYDLYENTGKPDELSEALRILVI